MSLEVGNAVLSQEVGNAFCAPPPLTQAIIKKIFKCGTSKRLYLRYVYVLPLVTYRFADRSKLFFSPATNNKNLICGLLQGAKA